MALGKRSTKLRNEVAYFFFDKGIWLLGKGKLRIALYIGEWLIGRRFSGGFELTARALWGLGRRQEASQCLEFGVKKFPTNYTLWSHLGEYRSEQAQFDLALEAFQNVAILDPSFTATYNIGLVHYRAGRYMDAIDCMRSIDLNPVDVVRAWAKSYLGMAYEEVEAFELARDAWRELATMQLELERSDKNDKDIANHHARWALMELKLGNLEAARSAMGESWKYNSFSYYGLMAERVFDSHPLQDGFLFEVRFEGVSDGVSLGWSTSPVPYRTTVFVAAAAEHLLLPYIEAVEARAGCTNIEIVEIVQSTPTEEPWQGVMHYSESRRKIR